MVRLASQSTGKSELRFIHIIFNNFKGNVQQKLRWDYNRAKRRVIALHCGVDNYLDFIIHRHVARHR